MSRGVHIRADDEFGEPGSGFAVVADAVASVAAVTEEQADRIQETESSVERLNAD